MGESYVHGLCDGEAILGPLKDSWKVEAFSDTNGLWWQTFRNASTEEMTGLDPRLGPLPEEWEGIQHEQLGNTVMQLYTSFRKKVTGEISSFDPRLSPTCLDGQGVQVTRFQLV